MCSLRSCPTQNARAGAGQHDAARRRVLGHRAGRSRAALLGRDVEAVHGVRPVQRDRGDAVGRGRGARGSRSWPQSARGRGQATPSRQRATNRSAPGLSRVASPANRSAAARARASRRAAARRAGRGRRRGTCATRARGGSARRTPPRPRRRGRRRGAAIRSSAVASQLLVRRAQRVEVPGAGRRAGRTGRPGRCGRSAPARSRTDASSARGKGLTHTSPASSAYPMKPRSARSRLRAARVGRRLDEREVPGAVPAPVRYAGRSGRRPRRAGGWRGRWRGSRGRRRAGPARASPA